MKIDSITLKGFRCFGDTPTTVNLSEEITAFVGANGSGKTALLEAILRVFGVTTKQRTVVRTDFHVPSNTLGEERSSCELYIDVRLTFPELANNHTPVDPSVPACFRHMVVEQPDATPFVRILLEAKWVDDGTVDGDIEQKLWWVRTSDDLPQNEDKTACEPSDRGLIQVHYVPAIRDPSSQVTANTGAIVGRLLKAVAWSSETQQSIQNASEELCKVFGKEPAVTEINQTIASRWKELHNDIFDAEPEFNIANRKFQEIIRSLNVVFRPTELSGERELDALSDGQKSLFYFSLVASVFELERKILSARISKNEVEVEDNKATTTGFNVERLQIPSLIIFAFEEPENHLAPYFLSRIIKQVRSLVTEQSAQAVLTSHSPAILGRIKPEEVRHFRLNTNSRTAIIKNINFSYNENDATKAKYIREAVNAYPELYFARFVILGEGDSEQVVLPRLALAMGLEVDPAFVAIVPLGGRHVNYFWRLLNDLHIPYATLLDLDDGRKGAGWGRIKYALKQLLSIGINSQTLLKFTNNEGEQYEFTIEEVEQLHNREEEICRNHPLIRHLETFGVFFSHPLDLDMAMLTCFPDAYKATALDNRGPKIPEKENQKYQAYINSAAKAVIGDDAESSTYPEEFQQLLPWYRYLFLTNSKPATHLQAISQITDEELSKKAPPELQNLLKYTNSKLGIIQA